MSRSGYTDDCDEGRLNLWRGAVASAIRGKRGQAFLREMLAAFDALPEKKLIEEDLVALNPLAADRLEVCSLGAVGVRRGLDMTEIDPDDYKGIAKELGIPEALAREVMYQNDEGAWRREAETPEARFTRMRAWVAGLVKP
jgi:hypothetical protein